MTESVRNVLFAAVIAAAACLCGCQGKPRVAGPNVPGPARDAEAIRIAARAQEAEKSGDTDKAIQLYRQSLSVSDNHHAVWNNLGLLLLERGQYVDAVEAFKRAADISPTDPRPMHNIGLTYSRAGWEQKAYDYYLLALERDPRDIGALRGAISAAKMLGKTDEASLERVHTALVTDTDPDWRRVYEREQSRIDGELRAKKHRAAAP